MLNQLLGLCLLRGGPQDLPTSRAILVGTLIAYGTVGAASVFQDLTWSSAVTAALVDTLLLAAATQVVLQWRRLENRMIQTLTALAGTGAVLTLLGLAVAALIRPVLASEWVWVGFLLWYALVFGHIVRHALSISLAAGFAAALVYILFSISVTGMFVEPVATAS